MNIVYKLQKIFYIHYTYTSFLIDKNHTYYGNSMCYMKLQVDKQEVNSASLATEATNPTKTVYEQQTVVFPKTGVIINPVQQIISVMLLSVCVLIFEILSRNRKNKRNN